MKRRIGFLVLLALAILAGVLFVAASYRDTPLSGVAFRPTVLTSADTTLTMPGGYRANQTLIVNDGAGRCYFNFTDTAVNTTNDMYIEADEALPPINVPWNKMHLRASSASATLRIVASY
jgi:hypothetical protein